MDDSVIHTTASLEQRLALIDSYLYWFGSFNRTILVEQLGFSTAQASLDIAEYKRRRPRNLFYDTSRRSYRAAATMEPLFPPLSPHEMLFSIARNDRGQPWAFWPWIPPLSAVAVPHRAIDTEVHRAALRAVRDRLALSVFYQSLEQPTPMLHRIAPHAIGFDGLRFHLRAYSFNHSDFRDYVLSRIISVRTETTIREEIPPDRDWNEEIELVFRPHPTFSVAQASIVEGEFGMRDGRLTISCRRSMALYLLRFLRAEADDGGYAPVGQELFWANREEFPDLSALCAAGRRV